MASIHKDERSGNWIVMFRWGAKQYRKSCGTKNRTLARHIEARVDETLRLLKLGRMEIPVAADAGIWIMSDGKLTDKPNSAKLQLDRIHDICDAYVADQLGKSERTIDGERLHIRHLNRVLGRATALHQLTLKDIQAYVNARRKQTHQGNPISGQTIRKELVTFHQIWAWAKERGHVTTECPIYNARRKWAVAIPKSEEKEKFQTWGQIKRRIARGGLTSEQEKELWDSLSRDEAQILELLEHVEKDAMHPFIPPMFFFVAYTGVRRGEILSSQIDDFDFEEGQVKLRERKRRKNLAQTFRFVPIHRRLSAVMQDWFAKHPGGPFTIAAPLKMPRRRPRTSFEEVSTHEAHHHLKHTLKGSKWEVLHGFHVFRHSFGSNLARSGRVPRDVIAQWMGHSTEEMKTLYQHLFPQDGLIQIDVLK